MKTKSDDTVFYSIIIIIVVAIMFFSIAYPSYKNGYEKGYDKGYSTALEKHEIYKEHIDSCDGSCNHVQYTIEDLIYDGELIRKDDLYKVVEESNEYYTEDEHWEALDSDSYIQGYEDCYYGYDPAY